MKGGEDLDSMREKREKRRRDDGKVKIANDVFLLCFQFVGRIELWENEVWRKRDGCVIGGEAGERRKSHCLWGVQSVGKSWVGGLKYKKREGDRERRERKRK